MDHIAPHAGSASGDTGSTLNHYTLNNIGSLEGTLQYYYHATPGEPAGFSWGCMVIVLKGSF